jgi:hypothetical protein
VLPLTLSSLALAIGFSLGGFHTNFRSVFPSSVNYVIGILMEIASNLQITFGSMGILTILILDIYDLSFFCLLNFFHHCLIVLIIEILNLWLSLSLGILSIVNGIGFLISFSDNLLLAKRSATGICVLRFYIKDPVICKQ